MPDYSSNRQAMVVEQLMERGIKDRRVLQAMLRVPRERFIPAENRDLAYRDGPLPIGSCQTISQPYIVAYMTAALQIQPDDDVLEIGTGCGYQTAILAELAHQVYTIEIIGSLQRQARQLLMELGYHNIVYHHGDGNLGWPASHLINQSRSASESDPNRNPDRTSPAQATFQAILAAASQASLPEVLGKQLARGGRMILPLGEEEQHLYFFQHGPSGLQKRTLFPVRFVPMTSRVRE